MLRDAVIRVGRVATNDIGGHIISHDVACRSALADLASRVDHIAAALPSDRVIDRAMIAAQFLHGRGLEIGALHRPLQLPAGVAADYVDAVPIEILRARFPEVTDIRIPDIIDDGEHLSKVADNTYDFVVANHFFEHTEDPFATLKNFIRVLRPGGHIFMAIPDKRWTFDRNRTVTTLDHLLADFREGPEISRRAHYEEWLSIVDSFTGRDLLEQVDAFIRDKVNIHFHVWTIAEMSEMFVAARRVFQMPLEIKLAFSDPPMLEVVWVLEVLPGA